MVKTQSKIEEYQLLLQRQLSVFCFVDKRIYRVE